MWTWRQWNNANPISTSLTSEGMQHIYLPCLSSTHYLVCCFLSYICRAQFLRYGMSASSFWLRTLLSTSLCPSVSLLPSKRCRNWIRSSFAELAATKPIHWPSTFTSPYWSAISYVSCSLPTSALFILCVFECSMSSNTFFSFWRAAGEMSSYACLFW